MGIENPTPTYIDDLDATLPAATDPLSQADDHIRNIKGTIKQTFPNVTGAVTATDASLNLLSGLQSIADAVYPVGCIYESTVSTDPSTLFPGTSWTAFGQGKMLVGLDPNDSDFQNNGASSGSKTVTLTEAQMPSHDHDDTFQTSTAGGHSHSVTGTADNGGSHSHGTNLRHHTSGSHILAGQSTVTAGNGFISKGVFPHSGTGTIGNNTTSHNGHTHSVSGTADTVSGHTHSITGSVSNAGGGQAHDNMPPYVVVYRWKRDS
jgi:microcystin-dependent protein